jgi:hypothetical protein
MASLPHSQFALSIFLLLEANWKPSVIRWGKSERILQRGQMVLSERGLSTRYGLNRQTVRDCIDALRRQGTISLERTHNGTILSWVNYLKYQDVDWSEEPTDHTTHHTTDHTDHNKVTRKQPTIASAEAADAIKLVTQYVGQVSKKVLQPKDAMAIRRRMKAGMSGPDIAARCYVLIQRKEAFSIAHALTAGFDIRVEKYASHIDHSLVEIRGRFGAGISAEAVAGKPRPEPDARPRTPEIAIDLVACERAVQSLGREAGESQDQSFLDDWVQSRLARQASTVGESRTVDGADDGGIHRPTRQDSAQAAGAARLAARYGADGSNDGSGGGIPLAPDDIPFP